jgi:hypothetical protein
MNIKTFIIDNSALTNLLKNPQKIEKFKSSNYAFLICKETYAESHSGEAVRTQKRMEQLAILNRLDTFQRFFFTDDISDWIKKEYNNDGILDDFPVFPAETHQGHLDLIEDKIRYLSFHANDLSPKTKQLSEQKKKLFDIDLETRKERIEALRKKENTHRDTKNEEQTEFTNEQLCNLLTNFSGIQQIDEVPPGYLKVFDAFLPTNYKEVIFAKSNDRYHYLKTYLNLMVLRYIGNQITSFEGYPQLWFLKEIKQGNWTDLKPVAMGSREFGIISDDNDQIEMYNFLKDRNLLFNEAIRLDQI